MQANRSMPATRHQPVHQSQRSSPQPAIRQAPSPARAAQCASHHQTEILHTPTARSEEHTSELQSLMRSSYAVFCLKKKRRVTKDEQTTYIHIIKIDSLALKQLENN